MENEATKTTDPEQQTQQAAAPADPPAKAPETPPATGAATKDAETTPSATEKTYTAADLESLKAQWQEEYEQGKAAEKDFAKMTPEQQAQKLLDDQKAETARLQAELADRDLADYTRGKLAEAQLPAEALAFVKGKDQADTDTRIKDFGKLLADGIQAGVDKRFKNNGYTPRGSAAGNTGDGQGKKHRGVSIVEKN